MIESARGQGASILEENIFTVSIEGAQVIQNFPGGWGKGHGAFALTGVSFYIVNDLIFVIDKPLYRNGIFVNITPFQTFQLTNS